MALGQTKSSNFGNTPQGQSQQRFQDILASITGSGGQQISPQVAQQGYQSSLSTQLAMNQNQAPFMEQAKQSLTQQSGIPQLQNQYGDLGKLFELYLADSNLADKYSNQSNTNPYANAGLIAGGNQTTPMSGEITSSPNPYLASADALAAGATPTGGGFTDPSLTTQAIGAPVNAAQGLMDLINQAIGIQEGRVTKKVGDVSTSYQKSLDTLGILAKVFGDAQDRAAKAAQGTAESRSIAMNNLIADDAQKGMTLPNIMKKYGTQVKHDDILQMYNNYSTWGPARENRDILANKYGISTAYLNELGLPTAKDIKKQKDNFQTVSAAVKGFGDLANEYWNNSNDILGARFIDPTSKAAGSVEAMKKVYTGKLQQALKIGRGKYNFEQLMASIPGNLTLTNKAEGQLRGHLTELLTNNDLLLVKDNSGRTGITNVDNFDPNTETEVDIMNEPFNNILGILKGL